MRDDIVSRSAVMASLVAEYNRRYSEGGLKLAWIEKAVNDTPALQPSGGRLIYADRLKQHYAWWPENERTVLDQIVDVQPTIDAVPVVHGEWEDAPNPQWKAYDIRHCSCCGWNIHKSKLRIKDLNWKYCPNCGAKMDGGAK